MNTPLAELPVVVIGAGPVGLVTAAHLHERGLPFTVLEAGNGPGAAVRQWGHVRLFSPWRYSIDRVAARLLAAGGWVAPDPRRSPVGTQFVNDYLRPLADLPALKPNIHYRSRVGALQFQFYLNGPDGDEIRIQTGSLTGKTPADVLPAMRMAADFADGNTILLAVRGGRPLTSAWDVADSALRANAGWHVTLLEALTAIQRHTYQRVTIPDVQTMAADDIETILRTGRPLRGERIEAPWTEVTLTVVTPDRLPSTDAEFSLISERPITVRLGDREITVAATRCVLYQAARVANPAEIASAEPGATIRLLPGSIDQAVIVVVPIDPHTVAADTRREARTPDSVDVGPQPASRRRT